MRLFSAAEAAKQIGCARRTLSRHARQLGLGQIVGGARVLTAREIARIRAVVRAGPGNPTFGTAAAPRGGRPKKSPAVTRTAPAG